MISPSSLSHRSLFAHVAFRQENAKMPLHQSHSLTGGGGELMGERERRGMGRECVLVAGMGREVG